MCAILHVHVLSLAVVAMTVPARMNLVHEFREFLEQCNGDDTSLLYEPEADSLQVQCATILIPAL